jgi:hypothetical protein
MTMQDVIAQKDCWYDGREWKKGERFQMQPGHVRLFQILKRVEVAPPEADAVKPTRGRRAMLPADPEPPAPEPTQDAEPPPGRYARRDMRAVDEP